MSPLYLTCFGVGSAGVVQYSGYPPRAEGQGGLNSTRKAWIPHDMPSISSKSMPSVQPVRTPIRHVPLSDTQRKNPLKPVLEKGSDGLPSHP